MRPLLCLSLLAVCACVAACEATVDNTPEPAAPVQPASQPDGQPQPGGPTSPPTAHPAPGPATPAPNPDDVGGAQLVTPRGVEAVCYNLCMEQSNPQATTPKEVEAQCQASCSIADKCLDAQQEGACARCCRSKRSRGSTFADNRCTCN